MTRPLRALKTVLSLLCAGLLTAAPLSAQTYLSTDAIFERAHSAWYDGDYVRAYGYLEAYFQRNPPGLSDAGFRADMVRWYGFAYENAHNRTTTASSGTGSGGSVGSNQSGLSFQPPDRPAPPRSYRMRCTGGGQMSANYYPFAGNAHTLSLNFAKAPGAAGGGWPAPGQCAWIDRPIHPDEPFWMVWQFDAEAMAVERIMFGSAAGIPGLHLPANDESHVLARIMAVRNPTLAGIVDAIHWGRSFEVECYNNRGGQFVVTRVAWVSQ